MDPINPDKLWEFFEELAIKLEIKIIQGDGDFEGGACTINDEKFIVVNKRKPIKQRLRILARGFAEMDLSGVYLVPALRSYIDAVQTMMINEERI